jgi:hypothetical protein
MTALTREAGEATFRAARRRAAILGCVAGAATAVLAATAFAAGPSGTGAHAAAAANGPVVACLPKTLVQSAKLSGVSVDVSPAPGSVTANPDTQISFLGVAASQVRNVSVSGASSGDHPGSLHAYSQGDGASFVPATPFKTGEQVTVHAVIGAGAGKRVSFGFRVDTPYSTAGVGEFGNPTAAPTDYQTFFTLPGVQAPVMTVTVPDHDPAAGDILTTNGPGPGRYGPLIYSPQGRLIWFDQLSGGVTAEDLNVQTYNGQRDLTFWQGKVLSLGYGDGKDLVLNSRYQTVATVKGGNGLKADLHEFQLAAHNIAYITTYNPIDCDLASVQGPRDGVILDADVQEIDMKTGLVRWEWHALDHVAAANSEFAPDGTKPYDWFHINSIDPQPNGDVLISARNTWAAYQLQAGTGTILWTLGGLHSSFKKGPADTAWQHDARMLSNGEVTMFDDGSDPPEHSQSRAVRISLDLETRTATLVSALTHPGPPLLAASQGNMQTLASGNTVVGYGGIPQVSEYSKSGSLLFDAHLSYDMASYRDFRFPWSGRPASAPAVLANLNNTDEETIVHMSWNGATDVASWRVLAGKDPSSLAPQTTTTAAGFETATIVPKTFETSSKTLGYVAVQALDSSGRVLATSHTVPVKSYAASFPTGHQSG